MRVERIERERALAKAERDVEIAAPRSNCGDAAERRCRLGVEFGCAAIACQRGFQRSAGFQRHAPFQPGRGRGRIEPDRLVELAQRFAQLALLAQHRADGADNRRVARRQLKRLIQQRRAKHRTRLPLLASRQRG